MSKLTGNSSETEKKKPRGKPFKKGQSGNPSGRKKIPEDIKQAFKELTPIAIEKLTELLTSSEDERIVMDAVKVVFDRHLGKALQQVESKNENVTKIVLEGDVDEWAT